VEYFRVKQVSDVHESKLGWMASIDVDIKLHSKLVDAPFAEGNAHYTSSLRISPFVAHAGYGLSPAVSGNYVGLTISYAGMLRWLNY